MLVKLNKMHFRKNPLEKVLRRRAERNEKQYARLTGMVERNIERNEGERAFLADDVDMIHILSTYRV